MTLIKSLIIGALFASSVYCLEKHASSPKLRAHASPSSKDYWSGLTAQDLFDEFGDDWAGSSTLSDGSHNPNEIKGWGSASAGSWTQSKPKPEADDQQQQQQMQMPQQGGMQYGQQMGGGMQYGYSSGGFGYSSGGYQQQQPSYGYSSGYGDQSGYSSAGFGYSTGYDQSGYSSAGFSVPTGGSMPGGQQPMGAPQPGGSTMGAPAGGSTMGGGMPQQPGGMPAGGAMGGGMAGGMPGGKGMMPGGAGMAGQGAVSGKCPLPHRHRKPWALLTDEQKDMFIDGFQQVRKNGKLDVIAQTHGQHDIENYVHYTSLFTFYNAYLVWELESAIRDLGGKFACFTMPYYDWTLDAGLEDDPTILHSGIGGDGDIENDLCVTDDETGFTWQTCSDYSQWRTVDETATDEGGDDGMVIEGGDDDDNIADGTAAERDDDGSFHYGGYDDNIFKLSAMYMNYGGDDDMAQFAPGANEDDFAPQEPQPQDPLDPNAPQQQDPFFEGDELADDDFNIEPESVEEQCYWTQANCRSSETSPFCCLKRKKSTSVLLPTAAEIGDAMYRSKNIKEWQGYLNEWQNKVHALFGSDYYAHMSNGYATEDPIFWLTQSFTVHLFSLWQDCWNYNNIPKDKLDMHYNSYHPYCGTFDAIPSNCVQFNLALDAPMNFYELQKAEWSMSYHKIITVRKMWTPDFWNVVYELGPFYTQSGVNNWCDNTRDSEWFIETMDYDVDPVKTPVNIFSKNLREQMIRDGAEPSGVFKTVGALSCRYNRKYSENSCWDDTMEDAKEEREVCDPDLSMEETKNSTLEQFLAYEGVDENQCMKKIRRETFAFSDHSPQVKKQLCKGDWDYKCPEYNELLYGQYASFLESPVDASAKKRHNNFFAKSGWIWMIVINGILVIIVAIGCGIWHCSRSKTVKIPLRDENGDITVEDDSDDGNTFGAIQTSQEVEEYQPLLV